MTPASASASAAASTSSIAAYISGLPLGGDAGAAAHPTPTPSPTFAYFETTAGPASNVNWFHQLLPVFLILSGLALAVFLINLGSNILRARKKSRNPVPDVETVKVAETEASFRPPAISLPPLSQSRYDPRPRLVLEPHLALDARYMGYVSTGKLCKGYRKGFFG
ncbi:hypothetical protein B0H11DRAFT_2256214 [Mycena galericulata]|nr:hypothetical protein B0H11DRAFT_2256214 [Mycena galericulata]